VEKKEFLIRFSSVAWNYINKERKRRLEAGESATLTSVIHSIVLEHKDNNSHIDF